MSTNRIHETLASTDKTKLHHKFDSILAAGIAGLMETFLFYPGDTAAKRIQKKIGTIYQPGASYRSEFAKTIFDNPPVNASFFSKWRSLYAGLSWGFLYKFCQRSYKFGCQPLVQKQLEDNYATDFQQTFGANSKTMLHAAAGGIIGVGEVALLPIDVIKIKCQTNNATYQSMGTLDILRAENIFKGISITMLRNMIGSSVLFGVPYVIRSFVFNLEADQKPTVYQHSASSVVSAIASIWVTAPIDVVKTRLQASREEKSALTIACNMFRTESVFAFFKSTGTKILMQAPKLAFAITTAQVLTDKLSEKREETARHGMR